MARKASAASSIKVPVIYIKDKQAFAKKAGALRFLGNATETAKKLSKQYKLLHIIDLDLNNGNESNFDIYDKLTYFINIQVECTDNISEKIIERLLELKARVVLKLPAAFLEKFEKQERLLVGIVSSEEDASMVHDVLLLNPTKESIRKYSRQGKRIMLYESNWDKKTEIWAIILPEY
jgi:uncharacterized protein related to proFAR isomerase